MNEIALHILDIIQNSFNANAHLVILSIKEIKDDNENTIKVTINDDGNGMDNSCLTSVVDPFFTTRKTRKVGLGIPLFKEICELTGGVFKINSKVGKGTIIEAIFNMNSIDALPLGNIIETIFALTINPTGCDILFTHQINNRSYIYDTREIKEIIGKISIENHDVINWIKTYLEENERLLNDKEDV